MTAPIARLGGSGALPARLVGAGEGLLHPVALLGVALLVLNDHVLKASFPGFVTGKLSDVAGLAFFPLFLQAGWEKAAALCGRYEAPSMGVLVVATLATGIGFSVVELTEVGDAAYRHVLGILQLPPRALFASLGGEPSAVRVLHVADAEDLIALPALALALWAGRRRSPVAHKEPR